VEADPARLEQVFTNLLSNAGKYTEPGGRVTVWADICGDMVVLRICDTGIGIAPEMLARVWDLFAQADRTLDRAQGGLGIGLTVPRRLVEMHDAHIEAQSDGLGKGAEFIVTFPMLPAPSAEQRPPTPVVAPILRSARILVIDDNRDAADSLST